MKCEICGLNLIPLKMGGFAHYESGKLIMDCKNVGIGDNLNVEPRELLGVRSRL